MVSSLNLLLIGCCTLAEVGRELCFKRAADKSSLGETLRQPLLWVGIPLWGLQLAIWLRVLQTTPLSVAYPLMALVYVLTQLAGVWLLREAFNLRHAAGALLITAGVACIGSSGI